MIRSCRKILRAKNKHHYIVVFRIVSERPPPPYSRFVKEKLKPEGKCLIQKKKNIQYLKKL